MIDKALLSVDGLAVNYGVIPALRDATLILDGTGVLTVVGANGAGKTSLLRGIMGMERCAAGRIRFDSQDISAWTTERRVAAGLAMVPQGRRVFPESTVRENLMAGAFARLDREAVREDVETLLDRFPILRKRETVSAGYLSGGEQQMLAVARALISKPKLLLLDEPSMGLAPVIVAQIYEVLGELKANGMTMLLVEQNVNRALELADRVYVLRSGIFVTSNASVREIDRDQITRSVMDSRPRIEPNDQPDGVNR